MSTDATPAATGAAAPRLCLRLVGVSAVVADPGPPRALDPSGALLAARLVLEGPQSRAQIAAWLWPEVDSLRARANLRQRLVRLKALAGGHEWVIGDALLQLAPGVVVEPLQPALDAPDLPLLQGVPEPADEELAQWLAQAREAHLQRRVGALQQAVQVAEAAGRPDEALALLLRVVALQPLAEAPRRAVMRHHYLAGDIGRARSTYDELRRMLAEEFGARPSDETEALLALLARAAPGRSEPAPSTPPGAAPAAGLATRPAAVPLVLQRPPRLVGREAERRQVVQALGDGGALLLLGEAGMGKSRLLSEVLAEVLAGEPPEVAAAAPERRAGKPSGRPVLQAKARAGDAGVPYATLARLLRELLQTRRSDAGLRPALTRLLPEMAPGSALQLPADGERLLLQQAVQALFEAEAPSVVAVDDLHFADAASLEMLQALIGSEPLARLPWLLTQRPAEGPVSAQALHEALLESGRLQRLVLQPLGESQMVELVASLGLADFDAAEWGPRLARHCGGNPLFALETLKQLAPAASAGARGAPMPSPAPVLDLIERRLRGLGERALALARTAAIAGPDMNPALAETVLGRPAVELADAWAELEAAQVLRDGGFAHDLVLEATLRSLPQAIARHLHGAVAQWLARQPAVAEPARVAMHWLEAGDEGQALPWLLQAADRAQAGLRRVEEAAFVERALAIAEPRAQDLAAREQCFQMAMRVADARWVVGGPASGLQALQRAAMLAGTPTQRALCLREMTVAHEDIGDMEAAGHCAREGLAMAEAAGDAERLAEGVLWLSSYLTVSGNADEALALLDRHWPAILALQEGEAEPWAARAMALDNLGRIAEAREFHEAALQRLSARGRIVEQLPFIANYAVNRWDAGDLTAAIGLIERSAAIDAAHADDLTRGQGRWLGPILRDAGRYGAAWPHFERTLGAERRGGSAVASLVLLHRAWAWADVGQWARALQDLAAAGDAAGLPGWVPLRMAQLRVRIARGSGQPAAPLRPEAEALAGMARIQAASVQLDAAWYGEISSGDASAAAAVAPALATLADEAERDGVLGLHWSARLRLAQAWQVAGARAEAAAAAEACMLRDAAITPVDLPGGRWWHALWRLWQGLGDAERAAAARAEGMAWIHRTLQRELAPEFRPGFREAVREHRELLLG